MKITIYGWSTRSVVRMARRSFALVPFRGAAWSPLLEMVAFACGGAVPPQVVAWSPGTAAPWRRTPASWVGTGWAEEGASDPGRGGRPRAARACGVRSLWTRPLYHRDRYTSGGRGRMVATQHRTAGTATSGAAHWRRGYLGTATLLEAGVVSRLQERVAWLAVGRVQPA
jgi:hypothetical protein